MIDKNKMLEAVERGRKIQDEEAKLFGARLALFLFSVTIILILAHLGVWRSISLACASFIAITSLRGLLQ